MAAAQKKASVTGGQSSANIYNKTHVLLTKLKALFREQTGKNVTIIELTHFATEEFYDKYKDDMSSFLKRIK